MKKLFALLLVVAMFATLLVACNDDTTSSVPESEGTSSTVVGDNSDVSTDESTPDESSNTCWLPEKNWNTELVWASGYTEGNKEDIHYFEIVCDEELGDTISQEVYNRTSWLETTYGITIEMVWNPSGGAAKYAETCISSDLPLDVVSSSANGLGIVLGDGNFYDIRSINAQFNDGNGWMKLDESYYDQNAIRDYSIANKLFMITGDIVLFDDEATYAMFFNKDLVEQYGIDPYRIVKNDEWTIDYLYSLCREYTVADGDKLSLDPEANQTWGLLAKSFDGLMFMLGCGQSMISKDSDDLPILRLEEQRYIDVAQSLLDMLLDPNAVGIVEHYADWKEAYVLETKCFMNGHCMFMPQQINFINSAEVKAADLNIGIVPMPKVDELSDGYSSTGNPYWLEVVAIPLSNDANLEATLYAIEAMSWYGQRYVRPVYYEKVLKLQKFNDEDAEEMLDLIFNNRTYDMGVAYSWGDMIQFFTPLLGGKSKDVVSNIESKKDTYQAAIDNAIATFSDK